MNVGIILIAVGNLAILDRWRGISLWRPLFPLLIIALGAGIIVRPSRVAAGTRVSQRLPGDVVRHDEGGDEDVFALMGDVKIDWRAAAWPSTPVDVRVSSLLGDMRVKAPEGVGVSLVSSAAISSIRLDERQQEAFLASVELHTPGYEDAASRLDLDVVHLPGDVRVERGQTAS